MNDVKLTEEQKRGNPLRVCIDGVPVTDQRAGIEAFKLQCLQRSDAAIAMARSNPLAETSLQTIIESPNFREYEKAMAREILRLRASKGTP